MPSVQTNAGPAISACTGNRLVAVSHGRKVVSAEDIPEKTLKHPLIIGMTILPVPLQNGGAVVVVGTF